MPPSLFCGQLWGFHPRENDSGLNCTVKSCIKVGRFSRFHYGCLCLHANIHPNFKSLIFISVNVRWGQFELLLSSVQFSYSVVSNSLRPHGLQHTRPPCPSSTTRVYSNSCPLSWWYHPTITFSVIHFSSCLQYFPASGSFLRSPFFASDGQSVDASPSASVLPMNIQH